MFFLFMVVVWSIVLVFVMLFVYMFGFFCVMCGGNYLFVYLGLLYSYIWLIIMYMDIVFWIFVCDYFDYVMVVLKCVSGIFCNYMCFF